MIVMIPVMQLLLFGYAINTTPRHLPTAVLIQEESDLARSVLKALENTSYFRFTREVHSVAEFDDLLRRAMRRETELFLASVITTLLGVLLGVFAARRAVRPVADAAQAAKAIAGGHLGTRLPPSDDPDLGVLAASFNDMASALQSRIERDARFASDVSHELRSPLMTLSASVEVMVARRNELPDLGAIVSAYYLALPILWVTQYKGHHAYEFDCLQAAAD